MAGRMERDPGGELHQKAVSDANLVTDRQEVNLDTDRKSGRGLHRVLAAIAARNSLPRAPYVSICLGSTSVLPSVCLNSPNSGAV